MVLGQENSTMQKKKKSEVGLLPNTTYKNKFKLEQRQKSKSQTL